MAMASRGAAATVQLPLGQLALVGFGALCVMNPDKFFSSLALGAQFLQQPAASGTPGPQQPIIIHHGAPAGAGSTTAGYVTRIVISAGLCWGSYVVLITILPEQAKELLPVNRKVFNQAVTSLGKAVINLKDTLMEQINGLSMKQDELSDKQDNTHSEVLDIKGNVQDVKGDLSAVQEALDLCQASLSESERRTSYIARGVQLLTRGVGTMLPENEHLMTELVRFNMAGEEFRGPAPLQQRRIQEVRDNLRRQSSGGSQDRRAPSPPHTPLATEIIMEPSLISSFDSPIQLSHKTLDPSDPENEVPKYVAAPSTVEQSVAGIHSLLMSIQSSGGPRRTCV